MSRSGCNDLPQGEHQKSSTAVARTMLGAKCAGPQGAGRGIALLALSLGMLLPLDYAGAQNESDPAVSTTIWARPFEKANTLGAVIEDQFASVFQLCGIAKLERVRKWGSWWSKSEELIEYSRVPQVIQHGLQLDTAVVIMQPMSLAKLFGYIGAKGEDPFQLRGIDNNRFIKDEWVAPPQLLGGSNRLVYTSSCVSTLDLAANAKLGLPLALRDMAINSFKTNANDQSVVLVEGTFTSPLEQLLNDGDRERALFGRLLVWDWYRRNPTTLTSGATYRARFNGLMLTRLLTQSSSIGAKAAFNLGGTFLFGSLDASLQTAIAQRDSTSFVRFRTVEYVTTAADSAARLKNLPGAQQLASEITPRAELTRNDPENDVLVQTAPSHEHTLILQGAPEAICQGDVWTVIAGAGTPGTLDLAVQMVPSVTPPSTERPWKPCRFTVKFTPDPAVFAPGAPRVVQLKYTIASAIRSGNDSAILKLRAQSIPLNIAPSPMLSVVSYDQVWGKPDSIAGPPQRVTIKWDKVALHVDDDRTPIQWTLGNAAWSQDSVALLCRGTGEAADVLPLELVADAANAATKQWSATLQRTVLTQIEPVDFAATPRQCTLRGFVTFKVKPAAGGGIKDVRRPLPTLTLWYPGRTTSPAVLTTPNGSRGP